MEQEPASARCWGRAIRGWTSPRFARLYEAGLLQLDEMITRRYRLDDINDGYRDLLNGEIIRGVIDFALD